jgi:hypothetical protein
MATIRDSLETQLLNGEICEHDPSSTFKQIPWKTAVHRGLPCLHYNIPSVDETLTISWHNPNVLLLKNHWV